MRNEILLPREKLEGIRRDSGIDSQEILKEEGAGIFDRPPGSCKQSSKAREDVHAPPVQNFFEGMLSASPY